MSELIYFPQKIENDYSSFKALINVHEQLKSYDIVNVDIDFSRTRFLAANLSALMGAIFDGVDVFCFLNMINFQSQVKKILQKNDFLSFYGFPQIQDNWSTTIKYKKFKANETQPFSNYIYDELFSKEEFPSMTKQFQKQVATSLLEIFVNAGMHGLCDNVYTCGQYFPSSETLDFTIVNLGRTIKENVVDFYKNEHINTAGITGVKAINWAVRANTTTKIDATGGLGLNTVRNFISNNKGKIQIISDNGFWEENACDTINKEFDNSFSGTIVNFEIRMNDNKDYRTKEETVDVDIFN